MVDVPLPVLTSPGRLPQAAGGRLINTYPEKLPTTAGKPNAYWRTPGLNPWGTTPGSNFRGSLLVNNLLYVVINNTAYSFPSIGGAGTALTGSVPGTVPVTMARNNRTSPDIVIVAPGDGAFWINPASPTAVVAYPDADVLLPNSVVFHQGFFIFTYGDGTTRSSDVNSTNINALNFATAESKPDTLYRAIPLGNGQLLLAGSTSIEVWGGLNLTGYPFSYVSTIARGIVGIDAIAGHQDGFGKGIFLVGDDFKVSRLDGYTMVPISTPDLDLLIEQEPDKTVITVSVYVSQGHGIVVVQGPNWCWEYDTNPATQTWRERKSHQVDYWRGKFPIAAFGKWICGDRKSGNLAVIDGNTATEFGTNAIQTITTTGVPTGGTFTLNYNGQITAALAFNATALQIQNALSALLLIGSGNLDCSGGPLPAAVAVRFMNNQAGTPQPPLLAVASLTGGATPTVVVTQTVVGVIGDPLLITIETGPMGAFPNKIRINQIELYLTKGIGMAVGIDPLETNPDISISISKDGGQTWSNPRVVKIGKQSLTDQRVRSSIWGQAQNQGVRWRLRESAPLSFAFMGIDMDVEKLR